MKSSATQAVETALAAIEAREGELHAWKALDPEVGRGERLR
jgi:hypothetical protein